MKSLKILALLFVLACTVASCSKEEPKTEDEKGIQIVTTRGGSSASGLGVACDFKSLFDKYKDEDEDIQDKIDSLDSEDLEDILDEIFNKQRTMYMIVAGDELDYEEDDFKEFTGEVFSLVWFADESPQSGVYEASGIRLNIEDPDNLKEDADVVSSEKIEVILETIDDDVMIGSFSGTYTDIDGNTEEISGSFNVDRKSCEK